MSTGHRFTPPFRRGGGVEDTFDSEKLVFFDSENHKTELMGGFGLTHLRYKGTTFC